MGIARAANRIEAAERDRQKSRRCHTIWTEWDDTEADLQAERDRMIAEGKASPGDEFIYVGWRAPQDPDPEVS